MKIGVMFGQPETTTGGNALKFYASVRLDIRRIGDQEGRRGHRQQTKVKVVKNKVARRSRPPSSTSSTAKASAASGAWYAYNGEKSARTGQRPRIFAGTNGLEIETRCAIRWASRCCPCAMGSIDDPDPVLKVAPCAAMAGPQRACIEQSGRVSTSRAELERKPRSPGHWRKEAADQHRARRTRVRHRFPIGESILKVGPRWRPKVATCWPVARRTGRRTPLQQITDRQTGTATRIRHELASTS